MNIIHVIVWLQMHIVVALNLWCNIVANTIFGFFCKFCNWKRFKTVTIVYLRFFSYKSSVVSESLLLVEIISLKLSV